MKTKTKQTTRTGTESEKWTSQGELSMGEGEEERTGKGTENKQHKWQVEDRQWEGKNSIGNVEAKELIYIVHGHELKGGGYGWEGVRRAEGNKARKKWDNCNSIINKIYF